MTEAAGFGVCEACKAPRSDQAMICAHCGYHFKTKPVPAYPSEPPANEIARKGTISDAPRTAPMTQGAPTLRDTPVTTPAQVASTKRSAGASPNSEAPRTVHSPSNPPEVTPGRGYVPVATYTPPHPSRTAQASAVARPAGFPWGLVVAIVLALGAAAVGAWFAMTPQ
jgi:hypothetical protein